MLCGIILSKIGISLPIWGDFTTPDEFHHILLMVEKGHSDKGRPLLTAALMSSGDEQICSFQRTKRSVRVPSGIRVLSDRVTTVRKPEEEEPPYGYSTLTRWVFLFRPRGRNSPGLISGIHNARQDGW